MNASGRAVLTALVLSLGMGLGGCQDAPESTEHARRVIGPAGGVITSTDSVLTLAIPPGALEQEVELFIERSDEPPAVFGPAYLVRPNPELRYDISVTYRQELPDDTSGLAVVAVDALEYEEGRGHWEPLPLLRVDRQAKLVSGLDDGVSIFYALLDAAEGDPSAPSGETGDTGTATTAGPDVTDDTGPPAETTGPSDSTGPGDSTEGSSGPGESTGEPPPSFGSDVEPILEANCNCHYAGAPAELSFTDAYASLVNVPSTEAGLDRVEPGAPDDSYLWHKLSGTHIAAGGSGDPMPAPAGGLAAGSLAIIEAWISGGAEP